MSKILVNAVGDACPIPVTKTIHALSGMTEAGTVEVHVDNETAVQNLNRLATVSYTHLTLPTTSIV